MYVRISLRKQDKHKVAAFVMWLTALRKAKEGRACSGLQLSLMRCLTSVMRKVTNRTDKLIYLPINLK